MGKVDDAAKWMLAEVQRDPPLHQESAVSEIEQRFGPELVVTNNNGNPAIHPMVLKAFRAISKDTVVWSRSERYWRLREPSDPPGKRQVDY